MSETELDDLIFNWFAAQDGYAVRTWPDKGGEATLDGAYNLQQLAREILSAIEGEA